MLAWPSHFCTRLRGTPQRTACRPKPCLKPLDVACGPPLIPAAFITALMSCQARLRDRRHSRSGGCRTSSWCADCSAFASSQGMGTSRNTTDPLRFFRQRMETKPSVSAIAAEGWPTPRRSGNRYKQESYMWRLASIRENIANYFWNYPSHRRVGASGLRRCPRASLDAELPVPATSR